MIIIQLSSDEPSVAAKKIFKQFHALRFFFCALPIPPNCVGAPPLVNGDKKSPNPLAVALSLPKEERPSSKQNLPPPSLSHILFPVFDQNLIMAKCAAVIAFRSPPQERERKRERVEPREGPRELGQIFSRLCVLKPFMSVCA